MFTIEQLVAHGVGDYLLQSHWMAQYKTKSSWAALPSLASMGQLPGNRVSRKLSCLAGSLAVNHCRQPDAPLHQCLGVEVSVMAKLQKIATDNAEEEEYVFECPGCGGIHMVRTKGSRPRWEWNEDLDRPTFMPSLLVAPGTSYQCHSFIKDGNIQFLEDCWHELKGQTVEIPDWQTTK